MALPTQALYRVAFALFSLLFVLLTLVCRKAHEAYGSLTCPFMWGSTELCTNSRLSWFVAMNPITGLASVLNWIVGLPLTKLMGEVGGTLKSAAANCTQTCSVLHKAELDDSSMLILQFFGFGFLDAQTVALYALLSVTFPSLDFFCTNRCIFFKAIFSPLLIIGSQVLHWQEPIQPLGDMRKMAHILLYGLFMFALAEPMEHFFQLESVPHHDGSGQPYGSISQLYSNHMNGQGQAVALMYLVFLLLLLLVLAQAVWRRRYSCLARCCFLALSLAFAMLVPLHNGPVSDGIHYIGALMTFVVLPTWIIFDLVRIQRETPDVMIGYQVLYYAQLLRRLFIFHRVGGIRNEATILLHVMQMFLIDALEPPGQAPGPYLIDGEGGVWRRLQAMGRRLQKIVRPHSD